MSFFIPYPTAVSPPRAPPSVYGSSHKAVIADVIAAIHEDREPGTNGAEARKSVALVLAMYDSARTGQPVKMVNGSFVPNGRLSMTLLEPHTETLAALNPSQ